MTLDGITVIVIWAVAIVTIAFIWHVLATHR